MQSTTANLAPHESIQELPRRPYLGNKGTKDSSKPTTHNLDFAKLLASNAPITWGQLLKLLPPPQLEKLLATLNPPPLQPEQPAPPALTELVAVHAAVSAHMEGALPENMFAPFTIPPRDAQGKLTRNESPTVHWGNVDTGSMVNIMYSGVLTAFPELAPYRREF